MCEVVCVFSEMDNFFCALFLKNVAVQYTFTLSKIKLACCYREKFGKILSDFVQSVGSSVTVLLEQVRLLSVPDVDRFVADLRSQSNFKGVCTFPESDNSCPGEHFTTSLGSCHVFLEAAIAVVALL